MRSQLKKAAAELKKQREICDISTENRAYISQGCIGMIRYHVGQYNGSPQYLATSGISPCIGITMYSLMSDERVVLLGHFDSSNVQYMDIYIELLAYMVTIPSAIITITLITSSTSFSALSKDLTVDGFRVGRRSLLETDVMHGARKLSSEMVSRFEGKDRIHMYDIVVREIKRTLPNAILQLAPLKTIEDSEDVCMDITTGEIKRYKETTDIASLQPQTGMCSRRNLNISQNMELYFLEGGQLRLVQFTDDAASTSSLQFSLSSSSKQLELPLSPALSTAAVLKVLGDARKGLKDVPTVDLPKLLKLPSGLIIGTAVDDGGCFFDALAQTLNQTRNTEEFSEKKLRLSCYEYYMEHAEEVDGWNSVDGVMGGIKGEDYCFVQYTKPELDEHFNRRIPIWGRSNIEGKMLCMQLNISKIHLIELNVNPEYKQHLIATYHVITADGEKQLDELLPYNNDIPTIIVSQTGLHFVPILHDATCLETKQGDPPIAPQPYSLVLGLNGSSEAKNT